MYDRAKSLWFNCKVLANCTLTLHRLSFCWNNWWKPFWLLLFAFTNSPSVHCWAAIAAFTPLVRIMPAKHWKSTAHCAVVGWHLSALGAAIRGTQAGWILCLNISASVRKKNPDFCWIKMIIGFFITVIADYVRLSAWGLQTLGHPLTLTHCNHRQ